VTYTDPEARTLVDCTVDPPRVVNDPPDDAEAEISLKMSADDAHRFWQGKLNMTVALAKKQVQVAGPMGKMLKLLPAMRPAFPRYREFLEANGFSDKVIA
jgi:putative sterol carrier protein